VAGVYFIGGFGVMGWIAAEEYAAAAPDPLAPVAQEIIRHMNADHADALRRIAGHDGGERRMRRRSPRWIAWVSTCG